MGIKNLIITNSGIQAINKAMSLGKELTLSYISVGSGNPGSGWGSLTSLVSQKVTASILSIKNVENAATAKGDFYNTAFDTSFTMSEIGLFCTDPDNAENNILLMYGCVSMDPENTEENIPAFAETGSSVKRTLSIKILKQTGTVLLEYAAATDKVTISEFTIVKNILGWMRGIVPLQTGVSAKTFSGLISQCHNDTENIGNRFTNNVLDIQFGGTGGSTPESASLSLGATLEALGISPEEHTHALSTTAINGFIDLLDKQKLDTVQISEWTNDSLPCSTVEFNGLKIFLFKINTSTSNKTLIFPSVFSSRCVYVIAKTATGTKATVTNVSASSVGFTVNANTLYTGFAIGY